jgi:aspartate-semialdehyde dehydrogenase
MMRVAANNVARIPAAASAMRRLAGGGRNLTVGVAGALGVVGSEMVKCLEERKFKLDKLKLLDKQRIGEEVSTAFGPVKVEDFSLESAQECDICFFAVADEVSKEYGMKVAGGPKNTVVIDNSSVFRYTEGVPLVIPEINMASAKGATYISNPNCTTAIGAMALYPLHQKYKIKSVIMSTYQASSGAGMPGMKELEAHTKAWVTNNGVVPKAEVFAHQLLFNVIPHIDKFQPNGYTKEEMKVSWEIVKIFSDPSIKVSCTSVRIPTLRAHSESIVIETEKPIDPEGARECLKAAGGDLVKVVDDPDKLVYPMPLNVTGKYPVEVGRIRQSLIFGDKGLEFFVSGDQLLRGAALNAVLIGEKVAEAR